MNGATLSSVFVNGIVTVYSQDTWSSYESVKVFFFSLILGAGNTMQLSWQTCTGFLFSLELSLRYCLSLNLSMAVPAYSSDLLLSCSNMVSQVIIYYASLLFGIKFGVSGTFSACGSTRWNHISLSIRISSSLNIFKSYLLYSLAFSPAGFSFNFFISFSTWFLCFLWFLYNTLIGSHAAFRCS